MKKDALRGAVVAATLGFVVAACTGGGNGNGDAVADGGGASSSSTSSSSSSSSSSGTASSSGSIDDAATAPCGTAPVDIDVDERWKYDSVIRGKVTLPSPGRVFLYLATSSLASPHEVGRSKVAVSQSEYTFQIRHVHLETEPKDYFLYAKVDASGDQAWGDGDWAGWYAGTTNAPTPVWQATPIKLSLATKAKCDADFGIGPAVCLKSWGDACSSSIECRHSLCTCNNGNKYTPDGVCDATGKCASGDAQQCDACSTNGGFQSVTMTGCLGG